MGKKTIVNSLPVPVQEVKHEEIEKVKQLDLTIPSATLKKTKKTNKKSEEAKKVKIVDEEVVKIPEPILEPKLEPEVDPEPAPVVESIEESTLVDANLLVQDDVDENVEVLESKDIKRVRRLLTKENFYKEFEEYVLSVNQFIDNIKLEKGMKNTKTALAKKLKQLQGDCYKLLKLKHLRDAKKPRGENNSGFMKPIKISNDLASFLKTDPNEPITRVQVTKKLCSYIKEKDLQNPKDRREILPDSQLLRLFNLGDEKLTYYSMQKQIQQHIYKI